MNNTVLVTGIGGNVGYGILRNIRRAYPEVRLVGTNTVFLSPGNHLCDKVYEVPFSLSDEYLPAIQRICADEQVQLIVPSTDYEVFVLSANHSVLPVVAASPATTCQFFLDKYSTYEQFSGFRIPFAESLLPSKFQGQFSEHIVKPRDGRGSRNIFLNHPDPTSFGDDFVVQKLYKGEEITTAFYVDRSGSLTGSITMTRTLGNGATVSCEVTHLYDTAMEQIIRTVMKHIEIRGACNIQCIANEKEVIPFEVNCRISGTNSIRGFFGFEDVKYTLDEYLFGKKLLPPVITEGSAVRILSDIIYPGKRLSQITDKSDHFFID